MAGKRTNITENINKRINVSQFAGKRDLGGTREKEI